MEDQEIIREFLIESTENLARLDQEMVELERQPRNPELLGSIFRTFHTIKGTCGFLGYARLEAVAHRAEEILSDLRSGARLLDAALTSLILEAVDAIKKILGSIEESGAEGPAFEEDLLTRLSGRGAKPADASPPDPAVAPAAPAHPTPIADTTIRVDVGLLDRLMNLAGELVLTRNQVLQYNGSRDDVALNVISQRLNLVTTELQEGVMKTRMQPIGVVWNKLPRVVRDLAAHEGKEIGLEMDGADTELDRTIIEAIKDPLTHIVRNACDHGIERPAERLARGKPAAGRLALRAFHEGGQVNIEIADDGGGIDPSRVRAKAVERGLLTAAQAEGLSDQDAVNLVFLPGFSTAAAVTSISGRGVGMDVVKTNIERIGGAVELVSRPGEGATVRVKIPLTLAIIPGLVVWAGGERFVIPQAGLHELIRVEGAASHKTIEYVHATPIFRRRNALVPLADLCQVMKLESRRSPDELSIVVLQAEGRRFGLLVDTIGDTEEIVVKPLGQQLKGLSCYAGATIMGDGRIALILDVAGVGMRSGVLQGASETAAPVVPAVAGGSAKRKSLLLFGAGSHARLAIPLSRVARLEKIPRSSVEHAGGRPVVQYRGRMLPLLSLEQLLEGSSGCEQETIEVVVYGGGEGCPALGLMVDEIIDIVEETVTNAQASDRPGLLGSAVVGGKVTDFLDLDYVAAAEPAPPAENLHRLQAALAGRQGSLEEVAR